MMEISCGTVLFTKDGGKPRYVLVRSLDSCGLPKGHMEPGETQTETALRETWEETCVNARILPGHSWEIRYALPGGGQKTAVFYLASYTGQVARHNEAFEPLEVLLLPYEQANEALTYPTVRAILREADAVVRNF